MFFLNRPKPEFLRDLLGCKPNEDFAAQYRRFASIRIPAIA
jgi:hypothetical protein